MLDLLIKLLCCNSAHNCKIHSNGRSISTERSFTDDDNKRTVVFARRKKSPIHALNSRTNMNKQN